MDISIVRIVPIGQSTQGSGESVVKNMGGAIHRARHVSKVRMKAGSVATGFHFYLPGPENIPISMLPIGLHTCARINL